MGLMRAASSSPLGSGMQLRNRISSLGPRSREPVRLLGLALGFVELFPSTSARWRAGLWFKQGTYRRLFWTMVNSW